MNVLIYASSASHQLSNAFRSVLSPFYTVQSIVPGSLATQPWTASCALLVLSSDNSPAPLSLPRSAHEAIQDYVTAGGRILGVGLGVSCLPHRPGWDRFDLWDARSSTAIVPEPPHDVSAHSPPSSILLRTGTSLSGLRPAGVSFELTRITSDNKIVHGHWEEANGAVAGIQVPIGFGNAAFWDVSPHLDGIEDTASVLALLRYALTSLDLMVPPETIPDGSLGPIVTTIPRRPLPQFFLHPPGKRHIAETVLRGLGLPNTTAESSDDSVLGVIKDTADTFHFHKVATLEDAGRLMAEAREVSAAGTSSHVASVTTDAPRIVVVLPPDVLPARNLTPQFDAGKYFDVLASVRGDKVSDADNWGMGEALFYGEAVTSTQTMLDRNPRFQASLLTPIVSLATSQLSGRGRGSNTWLSPPGCLQVSILVRAPALPAHRLVFVQYLAALAVVRACRDERALGAEAGARVRLKWPNDVYIDLPSSSGAASSERKKVGGVLVNTSFSDGNVHVVIGWGIDVCTPAPVTALSLLSRAGERLDAETVLALILTEFERLWDAFVAGQGSWAPFEEDYLDAWMHSDQLVTLTTVDPPIPVRIVGITHDHGLLRTIPERTGWGTRARHGADDGYIDLQPDGNSFDIMMGLIKAKKGHS